MMEMAKVTSKGQITIPISIRRNLGINEGDKILFINKEDGVLMVNPDTFQGDLTDETTITPASAPATLNEVKKDTKKKAPPPPATPTPPPVAAVAASVVVAPTVATIEEEEPMPEPIEPPIAYEEDPVQDDYPPIEYAPQEDNYAPPPSASAPPPIDDEPEKQNVLADEINLSTLLDDIRSIGSNI